MDCLKVREMFSAYLDSELPPNVVRQVRSHLDLCSACAQEVNALRQLTADLENLPAMPMAASLQRRIMKAFRALQPEIIASPRWYSFAFNMDGLACCMAVTGFLIGLFLGGSSLLALPDISGQSCLLACADMEGIFR